MPAFRKQMDGIAVSTISKPYLIGRGNLVFTIRRE